MQPEKIPSNTVPAKTDNRARWQEKNSTSRILVIIVVRIEERVRQRVALAFRRRLGVEHFNERVS